MEPASGTALRVDQAHNEFLQVAAEPGLVGLGLLAWLGVRVASVAVRIARDREPRAAAPGLVAAVGLAGLAVDAFFSFPLHRAIPPLVAAAYLGLLAAGLTPAGGVKPPAGVRTASSGLRSRWLKIGGVSAALLVLLGWPERRLRCDRHVLRTLRADAASDWHGVIAEGTKAHRVNPSGASSSSGSPPPTSAAASPRTRAPAFPRPLYPEPVALTPTVQP